MTREQVAALLRAPREAGAWRDHYLLASMYYLARRVGEAVLLQPDHFRNLSMNEIVVPLKKRLRKHRCRESCPKNCAMDGKVKWPRGMLKDGLTGMPLKAIPVVDGQQTLREMLKWAGEKDWIFPGMNGGHLTVRRAQAIFRVWADSVGLPKQMSPHSLRHTAVSFLVEAAGVAVGRDVAAHSSIAVTDLYTHTTAASLKKARGSLALE